MSEFIDKHTIKIQLIAALGFIGFIIYWTFIGATYAYQIDINTRRIDKIEAKLDQLVTKSDLQILKQDIKDFIK